LSFAVYYASTNQKEEALASLKAFAKTEGYQYWFVMFIEEDPLFKSLAADPACRQIMQQIKDKFWKQNQEMRKELEAAGLI